MVQLLDYFDGDGKITHSLIPIRNKMNHYKNALAIRNWKCKSVFKQFSSYEELLDSNWVYEKGLTNALFLFHFIYFSYSKSQPDKYRHPEVMEYLSYLYYPYYSSPGTYPNYSKTLGLEIPCVLDEYEDPNWFCYTMLTNWLLE